MGSGVSGSASRDGDSYQVQLCARRHPRITLRSSEGSRPLRCILSKLQSANCCPNERQVHQHADGDILQVETFAVGKRGLEPTLGLIQEPEIAVDDTHVGEHLGCRAEITQTLE